MPKSETATLYLPTCAWVCTGGSRYAGGAEGASASGQAGSGCHGMKVPGTRCLNLRLGVLRDITPPLLSLPLPSGVFAAR